MDKKNTPILKFKEKIAYGSGDFASNLSFHVVNCFLAFYLTEVFLLDAKAVSLMILIGGIWDAINDPMMGAIADRTNTVSGKYRPYLKWFAIPYGVLFYALFSGPDLNELGKLIFVWTTFISLRMVYTAINVPYSALMGVVSSNAEDRVSLSTFRFTGAFSAQLLVGSLTIPLVMLIGNGDNQRGWSITMGVFAVLAALTFLYCYKNTKERLKPEPQADTNLSDDITFLFRNVPFLIMFFVAICTLSNVALRNTVGPYYFEYFLGAKVGEAVFSLNLGIFPISFDLFSLFNTAGLSAFVIGCLFGGSITKLLGKKKALILLTLSNALIVISFYFISPDSLYLIFCLNIVASLLAGPTPALVWALYTDIADYNEWKFNRRSTGLIFSSTMFAQKFGYTIGASGTVGLMSMMGYVAGMEQNAETLNAILMSFSIIPGGLAILSGIILLWFPLDECQTKVIQDDLEIRRASH